MAFGTYRNSGIHFFRDYGDALHKYENTKDIRGRVAEPKRPLGHRKSVDMYSIVKLENGDIQCVLYQTPVVTFHTDNTVTIKDGNWASQTTANFIPEVLGNVSARVFNSKICLNILGEEYFLPSVGMKLHRLNDAWQVVEPPKVFIHHIKRKESNNVIRKYEDFINYLERMRKLRHDGEKACFTKEEIEECFGVDDEGHYARRVDINLEQNYANAPKLYADFKQFIEDKSDTQHLSFYKAMLILVNTVGWIDWHTNERRMKAMHWEQAKNMVKNMAWGYHRDQVFTATQVKVGMVRKDTYGRFFEGSWNKYHENNNVR